MALHSRILIGLVLGAVAGITSNILWHDAAALNWIVDTIANPIGQIFLRLLFMIVVPLILGSVTLGVASLGDLKRLGRIGGRTMLIFLGTASIAVLIGLVLMNLFNPGNSISPDLQAQIMAEYGSQASQKLSTAGTFGIHILVDIVPRNIIDAMAKGDMLGLIFFSIISGVALTQMPEDLSRPVIKLLEGIVEIVTLIIGYAMKLAPYGVAGLIFAVTARFGGEVLRSLLLYVVIVLSGLILHTLLVIGGLAKGIAGISYVSFFRRCKVLMVTAFSTSSSNATLPTTIKTAQDEFGVPPEIASFVLPLGATVNMNGTALFEGMTVLFLAQVFGVDLSIVQQLVVLIMCVITAIGVSGIPGGSIPLLAGVLVMVNVPAEGIALILGVDRILDMSRTVPNVMGDLLTSVLVSKSEGVILKPDQKPS